MSDSTRKPASLLTILLWMLFGVIVFASLFPEILTAWPPDWVQRRTQRQLLSERVRAAGGWKAIKRDCALLVERHKSEGLLWTRFGDTNSLPAAVSILKPVQVRFDPPVSLRDSDQDATVPVVRIRIFGTPSTGGNAYPFLGLEVVCTTNTSVYEPRRGNSGGVPGNSHSTFRRIEDNVFEIY